MSAFRIAIVIVVAVGCGAPPAAPDAAPARDAGPEFCVDAAECDDAIFCNGRELCRPGAAGADERGCLAARAPACAPRQVCVELRDRCDTDCDVEPDADGDGADAIACGGTDCDDADAQRFPGHAEVCDADDHDEDCDAATFGVRDGDGDGAPDAACCNVVSDGTARCGTDCNDHSRLVAPGAAERCDGRDQDCDGTLDEGATVPAFTDADRDLHGDPLAPILGCPGLPGVALAGDDCDDTRGAVYLGAPEICDDRDDDCDGTVDESAAPVTWYRDLDGDGFGSSASGTTVSCTPPAGYSLFSSDCDDARAATSPLSREACNAIDDDCSGQPDFPVGPGDLEDDDLDGVADARCGAGLRDCDDADRNVHPGAQELCNLRDDDCDGAIETERATLAWYPDRDGDGAGDTSGVPVYSCDAVDGRVADARDCDDRSIAVGPGALDACGTGGDGDDDDCDGRVDEAGGGSAFYLDLDGDGFGAGLPILACALPSGRVGRGGDCDDARSAIHPALVESCASLDDRDGDCDGFLDCEDSDCAAAPLCGPPVTLVLASGAGQSALPGFPLTLPIVVSALGPTGTPVAGAFVHFRASPGAMVVSPTTTSDAAGLARTYVRVGPAAGPYTITASATGATPITIDATATAAPDGTWIPLLDAERRGPPGSAPDGLVEGASSIAARVRAMPSIDAMRFVGSGVARGLVVPLPDDDCVVSIDAGGVLHVVAGRCGAGGIDTGDEGLPGPRATLDRPTHVAVDAAGGVLFVADSGNRRVRAVSLTTGTITTIAGGGLEDPPAVGTRIASSAIRIDATSLAFDRASGDLWLREVGGACMRIAVATRSARGVALCPNTYPHAGLEVEGGTTILARAPIGPGDLAPPLPRPPTFAATPFGYVPLGDLPRGTDVRIPGGATFAGQIVPEGFGRTADGATFMHVGPTTGILAMDASTHPEAEIVRLTIDSRGTPGAVYVAAADQNTPGVHWIHIGLANGLSDVAAIGGGVVFSSPEANPNYLGFVDPTEVRVVEMGSPGGLQTIDESVYARFASAGATARYEEVGLDGVVTRTIALSSGEGLRAFDRAADGTVYAVTSRGSPPGSGYYEYTLDRFHADGTRERLPDLDPGACPGLSLESVSGLALAPTGALWIAASYACIDGGPPNCAILRRNLDGTFEHVAFRSDGTTAPGAPAPMLACTEYTGPLLAAAPDGTMIAGSPAGIYRIDPTTLAATPIWRPASPFLNSQVNVAVDAAGHVWIANGNGAWVVW